MEQKVHNGKLMMDMFTGTNVSNPRPWSVVSLFSGCGGLDIGFRRQGFNILYACDHDIDAVTCYRYNVEPNAIFRDVNDPSFIDELRAIGTCDVVLGGFPCQGFSKAGPKRKDDDRNKLYVKMQEAVRILRPKLFLAENVDGIQQNFGGVFVEKIRAGFCFNSLAYSVDYRVIDANAYGVPQHRRRAFFVGVRRGDDLEFKWPKPTHTPRERNGEFKVKIHPRFEIETTDEPLPRPKTIADAIRDIQASGLEVPDHEVTGCWPKKYIHIFRAIGPGQKLCNVRHSATSVYTWQIPQVFGATSDRQRLILETISRNRRHKKYGNIPNGNPLPIDDIERISGLNNLTEDINDLLSKGYLKFINDGFDLKGAMFCSGLFKRPLWTEPSPTVLTNFYNPRFFLHPELDRPLTLRECARLQGFSDDFAFKAAGIDLTAGYRLVGNAVPPPMGSAFASEFRRTLENYRYRQDISVHTNNSAPFQLDKLISVSS